MKFYGRENELAALKSELLQIKSRSRLGVVTGRRRIGKTTLLLKAAEESGLPTLYFFVQRKYSEAELAHACLDQVRELFHLTEDEGPARLKLSAVIRFIMKITADRPTILILDECQEIDRIQPAFWSELQEIWDTGKNTSHLALWMSGSVAAAIRHIFDDASEPLFGRQDLSLTIRPFTPALLTDIFRDHNPVGTPDDLLTLYAVTGGVARYVETLADSTPLTRDDMLSFVFSSRGEFLRSDGATVLANEFRVESPLYYRLLQAVADGKTRWAELTDIADGKPIGPYLERLEKQYGLLKRTAPLFSDSARGIRYHLADAYFRFWFRFVEPAGARALAERQNWALLKTLCLSSWDQFTGLALEDWFRESYWASGKWTDVGQWWDRKGENEIDLIAVNSLSKTIEIAEIKRNPQKIRREILELKAQAFLTANGKHLKNYRLNPVRGLSLADLFPSANTRPN